MCAAVSTEKWLCSEASSRSRAARTGRGSARGVAAERSSASSRASMSACRVEVVPPGVNMPSAPSEKPMRCAVQASSRRSIRVAEVDWSQVSTEVFTIAAMVSAATAGTATGQLRWAAVRGRWNHTAWRSQSSSSSASAASRSPSGRSRSIGSISAASWSNPAGECAAPASARRAEEVRAAEATASRRRGAVAAASRSSCAEAATVGGRWVAESVRSGAGGMEQTAFRRGPRGDRWDTGRHDRGTRGVPPGRNEQ